MIRKITTFVLASFLASLGPLAHAADSKSRLAVLFMAEEIGQHAKALAQEKDEAKTAVDLDLYQRAMPVSS